MYSENEVRPAMSAHGSIYDTVTTTTSNAINICFRNRCAKAEIWLSKISSPIFIYILPFCRPGGTPAKRGVRTALCGAARGNSLRAA